MKGCLQTGLSSKQVLFFETLVIGAMRRIQNGQAVAAFTWELSVSPICFNASEKSTSIWITRLLQPQSPSQISSPMES